MEFCSICKGGGGRHGAARRTSGRLASAATQGGCAGHKGSKAKVGVGAIAELCGIMQKKLAWNRLQAFTGEARNGEIMYQQVRQAEEKESRRR